MLPTRPPTDADSVPPPPDDAAKSEENPKRIPLVWIPATLGIGLLIAAIYLGGRIVTAHSAVQAPPVKPVAAAQVVPAAPAAPPAAAPESKTTEITKVAEDKVAEVKDVEPLTAVVPDDGIPMVIPQSGELYIQVGA